MANQQNLKPLTPEKAREYGSRGGKKSGEAKRKKKEMRETLRELLDMGANAANKEALSVRGEEQITNRMLLCISMMDKALNGDVRAAEFIRNTAGEEPISKLDEEKLKLARDRLQHDIEASKEKMW